METPLVTVICLCFNHDRFVKESLESVLAQTYSRVQLIVVDDASTDNSVPVIRDVVRNHPEITFLSLPENLGNCKAFNRGLALAKGDLIIDLAADDILMPDRIENGVSAFSSYELSVGVNFSDAELIDETGHHLGYHSDRFPHDTIPQGDIYRDLITRYFVSSPTMMFRRSVLEKLGGYDESLAYEDFDFWIRSSREFGYGYTPQVGLKKRVLSTSMSGSQYRPKSLQLISTFKVCEKIGLLNRNSDERRALRRRIFYEMRKAFFLGEWKLVFSYARLLSKSKVQP